MGARRDGGVSGASRRENASMMSHRSPGRWAWLAVVLLWALAVTACSDGSPSEEEIASRTDGSVWNPPPAGQVLPPPREAHDFSRLSLSDKVHSATARDVLESAGETGPDGSYRHSLPLDVPPGRGETTPKLSLEFSSRAGAAAGALGVGWAIGGLSMIHPCDSTVALDGIAAEGNQVCLDGARLVEVPSGGYRTEHDQVAKVVRLPARERFAWKVYLKDHRIRYYAKTTALSRDSPLVEEHDRAGNYARYSYTDGAPRRIDAIEYTFHTSGEPARREIVFHYERRPDPIARRVNGALYRWNERLARIDLLAPNPDRKERIGWYELRYEQSPETGYSRLVSWSRAMRRARPRLSWALPRSRAVRVIPRRASGAVGLRWSGGTRGSCRATMRRKRCGPWSMATSIRAWISTAEAFSDSRRSGAGSPNKPSRRRRPFATTSEKGQFIPMRFAHRMS
jgi:Salmonella virulence plasmid 65kDa B protein